MRVVPKATPRDAWQYVPLAGPEWPAWVMACTSIRVVDGEGCLILRRASGNQHINPFDWLIRDLDGDPEWLTDAGMRKEYQRVAE